MADEHATRATPRPSPALKRLDVLVGTWEVSGPDIRGRVRYEWMEGGFFLIQHVDFEHGGRRIKGMEIIGQERGFGADEPAEEITSRWYDDTGNTFQYTYEVAGDTLTIWGGERGSPAYYRGTFNPERTVNSGVWVYPGGGGYDSTMTRAG